MTKKYKYLDELTDKTKDYRVKVRVIEKSRPKQSPGKPPRQPLVLRDEKGSTMRAIIFGNDIPLFEQAVVRNGEYEIGDAVIAPVKEQFQLKENEFQLTFSRRMALIPLDGESSTRGPKYMPIQCLPRTGEGANELFDVAGIVLYVSDIRAVTIDGRNVSVRDIMIVDDSNQYPLPLTAWGDLAESSHELYTTWQEGYKVTGFTAMRIKTYNGFSLASTMSTEIILQPAHERIAKLVQWVETNETLLDDLRGMIVCARDPSQPRVITTLAEIHAKKAANIWLEQKFWIKVNVIEPKLEDLYFYMGCEKCGRKGPDERGITYLCKFCKVEETLSVPRVTFKIKVSDATGAHDFTVFTRETQTLIGFTCEQMHEYFKSDDQTKLAEQLHALASREIFLQIGPTSTIAANRMLSWVIRNISFE